MSQKEKTNIERRKLLSAIGVGLTGLSGCTGTADQPNGTSSNGSSSNGTTSNGSKDGVNEGRNQSNGSEETADSSEGSDKTKGNETDGPEETNASESNESEVNDESTADSSDGSEESKESEETKETDGSETDDNDEEDNRPTHSLDVNAKHVAASGGTYYPDTIVTMEPNPLDRDMKTTGSPWEVPEGTYLISGNAQIEQVTPSGIVRYSISTKSPTSITVTSDTSVTLRLRGSPQQPTDPSNDETNKNETEGGTGMNMGIGKGDEGGSATPSILSGLLRS